MTSRLVAIGFDADDPPRLARFWGEALGWAVDDEAADGIGLVADGIGFRISFRPGAETKVGQNRIHFDLTTTSAADQQTTVDRLLELGASHVDIGQRAEEGHVVLADPEGNELCVLEPGNRFLEGCGRLGAVNCDGTRETGCFWSAALGWPLVWDQDEETAIRSPDPGGPMITWSGPPLIPKHGRNRLRVDLAPAAGGDQAAEVERLVSLGATRIDGGRGDAGRVVLADPDGNELAVLRPQ